MINLKRNPFLSVIIPVFNEEKRLSNLSKIIIFLSAKKFKSEIVIINDGSTDHTLKKTKRIKNKLIHIISYNENRGKGYAIRQGMLYSKGYHKLFLDIDLSTSIEELDQFLLDLNKFDVLIGSRRTQGSKFLIRQPFLREFMGRVFTKFSQIFTQVNVSDFTCGFKCFSKKSAQRIFSKQLINKWGFDTEILFLASLYGFKIKEIPVAWKNDPRSRVKFPQDIITSFTDLIKIRINLVTGKYR